MLQVDVSDGRVLVHGLVIPSPVVVRFLEEVSESDRAKRLVDATEIGVSCLERATATLNLDFVRQQCEQQFHLLTGEVAKIPAKIQEELLKKIGSDDGQVLAPIVAIVGGTDRLIKERLESVKTLFNGQLDPDRPDTTLGRALCSLKDLLDPGRDGSVQKAFGAAIQQISADDSALVSVLKQLIDQQVKPLRDDLNRIAEDLGAKEAVAEALAETTAKGQAFEEELLPTLRCWAKYANVKSACVEHVGQDRQPGDIVVKIEDTSLPLEQFTIVLETRDEKSPRGAKQIADDMAKAMATRGAHYGVYVSKTLAGLAREIGDWTEGRCEQGAFLACPVENMLTALRFALVRVRADALLASRPEVDVTAIEAQLQRIRTALRRVKTIKTKSGNIRSTAEGLTQEAEDLRREVDDAMLAMEETIRCSRQRCI